MGIPYLSEEALEAVRSVLVRDFLRGDAHEVMEQSFDDIESENPVVFEWLKNTAISLERAALKIPEEYEIESSVPTDEERTFISLRLAQNMVLTTAIQLYKAIRAGIEIKEMEV